MLSSFSIISLIGVMLGVLVLVVVMAVYAGLERNVKDRILGYTPHVLLRQGFGMMENWEDAAKMAKALPKVEAATAYISDNVIFDFESLQRPVMFRGIDTADRAQILGIEKLLDLKNHPASTADLGIDDRVVISSVLVDGYKESGLPIGVGDKIRLYSTRNFEEVMRAYKATENPPVREAFKEPWEKATGIFRDSWKASGAESTLPFTAYREAYTLLDAILTEDIRVPEGELITRILLALDSSTKDDAAEVFRFDSATKASVEKLVADLNSSDAEKMDGETLKGLKSLVLPKEVEIVGVYQASQMAVTPDLFVPLPLAQDLAGLGDSVQGIALRLDNPYDAEAFATEARLKLVGSSRVDLQACKLEYSIVSPK